MPASPQSDETEPSSPEPPPAVEDESGAEATEEPVTQGSNHPRDGSLTVTDPDGTMTDA